MQATQQAAELVEAINGFVAVLPTLGTILLVPMVAVMLYVFGRWTFKV